MNVLWSIRELERLGNGNKQRLRLEVNERIMVLWTLDNGKRINVAQSGCDGNNETG